MHKILFSKFSQEIIVPTCNVCVHIFFIQHIFPYKVGSLNYNLGPWNIFIQLSIDMCNLGKKQTTKDSFYS